MTRTDVHSPTNLVTEDYTYVWAGDNQHRFFGGLPFTDEGLKLVQEINSSLNDSPLDRGHYQCHHCGAHLRYAAILRYNPTGAYIAVGETCLENRFERATAEFQALRKAAELDRQAQRIQKSTLEFLAQQTPLGQFLLAKTVEGRTDHLSEFALAAREDEFVSDVRAKLYQYGSLSERQVEAILRVPQKLAERAQKQVERDAEVKVPAPEGRVQFTGVVVSRKFKDNDFGGSFKLTIKIEAEAGVWLAWVSEPKSFEAEHVWGPMLANGSCRDEGWQGGCSVGDTVTMTATLTRSDTDSAFAFGKRPSKATFVPLTSSAGSE